MYIPTELKEMSRAALAGWACCHAVVSAIWDWEENGDWQGTMRIAEILKDI